MKSVVNPPIEAALERKSLTKRYEGETTSKPVATKIMLSATNIVLQKMQQITEAV